MNGCQNVTMSSVSTGCLDATGNVTVPYSTPDDNSKNALLYIICVLMFYAFSIVVLMIKYVRREKEEADQRNFFNEYVEREMFSTAQYQNRLLMQKLLVHNDLKVTHSKKLTPQGAGPHSNKEDDSFSISVEPKSVESV